MLKLETQIWLKDLLDKVTMQRTKTKTHTEACYSSEIIKISLYFPILVSSMHETDSLGFSYIPDAVFSFFAKVSCLNHYPFGRLCLTVSFDFY